MFKRVFGRPEVFRRFASAVLGIPITVEQVYTEYEYPKNVGLVHTHEGGVGCPHISEGGVGCPHISEGGVGYPHISYDLFAEDVAQRLA